MVLYQRVFTASVLNTAPMCSAKAASLGEDCAVYLLDLIWVNPPKPGRLRVRRWKRTYSRKGTLELGS